MAVNESGVDPSGAPFDFKGTTYAALAPNVRNMGGTVQWDNQAKTATVVLDGRTATVRMADENVILDGNNVPLLAPPLVVDDALYVPRTFFGDVLNRTL
jgi:hypothetical protein